MNSATQATQTDWTATQATQTDWIPMTPMPATRATQTELAEPEPNEFRRQLAIWDVNLAAGRTGTPHESGTPNPNDNERGWLRPLEHALREEREQFEEALIREMAESSEDGAASSLEANDGSEDGAASGLEASGGGVGDDDDDGDGARGRPTTMTMAMALATGLRGGPRPRLSGDQEGNAAASSHEQYFGQRLWERFLGVPEVSAAWERFEGDMNKGKGKGNMFNPSKGNMPWDKGYGKGCGAVEKGNGFVFIPRPKSWPKAPPHAFIPAPKAAPEPPPEPALAPALEPAPEPEGKSQGKGKWARTKGKGDTVTYQTETGEIVFRRRRSAPF